MYHPYQLGNLFEFKGCCMGGSRGGERGSGKPLENNESLKVSLEIWYRPPIEAVGPLMRQSQQMLSAFLVC